MISQLDDLPAITELFSLDTEFLKDRQIDIAGRLAFANQMATMIRELPARDEHRDFIPVMRSPCLTDTVVSCGYGDCLIH